MCRSSRILCFLLTIAAGPALAQTGAMRMAGPGATLSGAPNAAVRPGVSTGVQPDRGVAPNVLPGVRPGVERGIAPNRGVLPGVRPGVDRRGFNERGFDRRELDRRGFDGRRFGRVRGRGYGGIDAAGLGLGIGGAFGGPSYGDVGYDGPDPDYIPAYAPPRCVQPLIISIGHGLRHKVRTRIVYGQRAACVP